MNAMHTASYFMSVDMVLLRPDERPAEVEANDSLDGL